MDYFTRRTEARWISLLAFAMAGAGLGVMTLLVSAVVAIVIHWNDWIAPGRSAWNFDLVSIVGAALFSLTGLFLWRRHIATCERGGTAEAERLGAVANDELSLRATTEEFATALGMPTPLVYVLEEDAINAMSVGIAPTDAVVVTTRGALEELTRAELRALLAHECARIASGDSLLNVRIACATQFLLAPATAARWCRRRTVRGRFAITRMLWHLPRLIVATLSLPGYVMARGIKVVCARLRSDGADTDAIVLAGDPHGLSSLIRRTCDDNGSFRADVVAPHAIEFDHATFAPISRVPLGRRALWRLHAGPVDRNRRIGLAHGQVEQDVSFAEANLKQIDIDPNEALDAFLDFHAANVRRTNAILGRMPLEVRDALRTPIGCHAVLCALLTRGKTERQEAQRQLFVDTGYPPAVLEVRRLHEFVEQLDPASWVALADLAQPALREMPAEHLEHFLADASRLANGNADALEFFVAHVWLHHARGARRSTGVFGKAQGLGRESWPHTAALLLTVARVGNWDQGVARRAFGDASRMVGVPAGRRIYAQVDARIVGFVERAIESFERLRPQCQRKLLYSTLLAMAGDDKLEPHQVEMVRAIAKAFGCVVAPYLDHARSDEPGSEKVRDRVLGELWQDELAGISV